MKDNTFSKYFLIFLVILASAACLFLFRPFLIEIVIAAVLTSVFYSLFLRLSKVLKGRRKISALIMCLSLLLIIIIPVSGIIIFFSKKAPVAYSETVIFLNQINGGKEIFNGELFKKIDFIDWENNEVKDFVLSVTKNLSDWIAKGATFVVKGTTSFLVSLVLILLAMFFFFIDGERMLNKLKIWSPLPNKYDIEIFNKFREIGYTAIVSTFVTAGIQGLVGAIGFLIAGVPAFYPGLFIAIFSLIPYIGSMLVYIPIGLFLIFSGQIFQGVFIISWGALIIGNTDNLIRAYILHSRAKISPIFLIFSLTGGLILFGFWGLILGPLILSLVITIFHIYELEYDEELEK